MDTVTYPDATVARELSGWEVGKIDVSKSPEAARLFGVPAVPAAVAVSRDGIVLGRIEGFVAPEAFRAQLRKLRR